MKANLQPAVFTWPELPPLPVVGQVVLVRVAAPASRLAARELVRAVLRKILAGWSGLPVAHLPLPETPQGPKWIGLLGEKSLDLNLTHAKGASWIGLLRGGSIGIDALTPSPFAEQTLVARDFLGPAVADEIQRAAQPARAFALAWTEMEALLKCVKCGLPDLANVPVAALEKLAIWQTICEDGQVIAVATGDGAGLDSRKIGAQTQPG